jgi:peptide/nickel transport system substrate-binding protein
MNDQHETPEVGPPRQFGGKLRRIERVSLRHAHRFIVRRWRNLQEVQRHAGGWLTLVLALGVIAFWQTIQTAQLYSADIPAEDSTYTEAVLGTVDNLNPIFAGTQAERSGSHLLFANLMSYDKQGDLVGQLAQSWTSDSDSKVFTITLRRSARWSDDVPITASDVVFTFNAIKDADTKSPLYSSWRNIQVVRDDDYTVRFTLPASYAPFMNSLTVGILPQHMLAKIPDSQLRNNGFNRAPTVASGPFLFQDLRALDDKRLHVVLRLAANANYFLGEPKLNRFQLHAYADRDQLLSAFRSQEVAAVSDLSTQQLNQLGNPPDAVRSESPLYNAVYAFFKMDSITLSDVKVRDALQLATDRRKLVSKLGHRVQAVAGPLLPGQLGYRGDLQQPNINLRHAGELLDAAGWKLDAQGKRVNKDGQHLKLQLATVSSGDYPLVAQEIMDQWSRLGISFESQLVRPEDIQQNIIAPRAYDVLIYELALGRDPDIFAYWHSSQVGEQGFNLSDYKSPRADDALASARARADVPLREAKYHLFIQQWLADIPAVGLYRPSLSYVQTQSTTSFDPRPLVDQTDRYFNIRYWSATKEPQRPTL